MPSSLSWYAVLTVLSSVLLFIWGVRLGRSLLRRGATANDLFKGQNPASLAFLGVYVCLMVVILNVPQMNILPLEWRFHGMRITWNLMRILLIGACGTAITISWHTARSQVLAIALIGLIGVGTFSGAEHYLLAPIHATLQDNLRPNGVFKQTSSSSCAPAALATVLRQWGIPATESEVAELAGTSRMGTSMAQIIMAAREMNMEGLELNPTWEQIQQINRPGVLAFWLMDGGRKLPHAVALLGLNDSIATIADPAAGKIFELDRPTFNFVWRNQYVPIFQPGDTALTSGSAAYYLQQLGYLPDAVAAEARTSDVPTEKGQSHGLIPWVIQHLQPRHANDGPDYTETIRHFQRDRHLEATGQLDAKTILMLTGPFIQDAPRLDGFESYPWLTHQDES